MISWPMRWRGVLWRRYILWGVLVRYVFGLGIFLQFLRNLCCHLFLYLWSLHYVVYDPVEFTQSNHFTIGYNSNPGPAYDVLEVVRTG